MALGRQHDLLVGLWKRGGGPDAPRRVLGLLLSGRDSGRAGADLSKWRARHWRKRRRVGGDGCVHRAVPAGARIGPVLVLRDSSTSHAVSGAVLHDGLVWRHGRGERRCWLPGPHHRDGVWNDGHAGADRHGRHQAHGYGPPLSVTTMEAPPRHARRTHWYSRRRWTVGLRW